MKQVLLGAISNFSFLHGASHPQEMVSTAADMGWQAIGMADYGSMAGMVRAHMAAKDAAIKLLVGAAVCI